MSFLRKSFARATSAVAVVDAASALDVFKTPGCAAAIWRRQAPAKMLRGLSALDVGQLPRARVVLRPDEVGAAVERICHEAGTPAGSVRDWLRQDVVEMAGMFAGIVDAPYLRMRMDVVTTNACRKFHVDAITARLVLTYRGTGTQYGVSQGGHDPQRVFTVPTGAPILLRGSLWPETPRSGVVHRSPPIEGTGETRLVLVLDPVHDLDEPF